MKRLPIFGDPLTFSYSKKYRCLGPELYKPERLNDLAQKYN